MNNKVAQEFRRHSKPLKSYDITNLAKELKIKDFRGVFMRDTLPRRINNKECGVLNLDMSKNKGTHWVCYYKNNYRGCYYFDSFGLDPPIELWNYLNSQKIELSTFQIQKFNTHHCGYYCLLFLKLTEKYDFKEIVLDLMR